MTLDEENKIMWNALRDITLYAGTLEEAKKMAQAAYDEVCPFYPLILRDAALKAAEEVRVAS